MGTKIMTEAEITAAIKRKADAIRRKKHGDLFILQRCQTYHNIYRAAVEYNTGTTEPYILYKAYEAIAKERNLI